MNMFKSIDIYNPIYTLKVCPPIVIRPDNSIQIGLDEPHSLRIWLPKNISQVKVADLLEKYLSPLHILTPKILKKSGIDFSEWSSLLEKIHLELHPTGKLQAWISIKNSENTLKVLITGTGLISEYIAQYISDEKISVELCKQYDSFDEKLNACDLVVISDTTVPSAVIVNKLRKTHVPHLFVSIHDATGIIGPLVLPGLSACLHCIELYKREHDEYRPAVLAQMATYRPIGDISMVLNVSSMAVNEIKFIAEYRDHKPHLPVPQTLSTQIRVHHRPYTIEKISWKKHVNCGC